MVKMKKDETNCRDRLVQIINLAQNYKGWSLRKIAAELKRDPSRLIPDGGVPKLDLVMNLARILDWAVEDVAAYIWNDAPACDEQNSEKQKCDFDAIQKTALKAHRDGQYREAVELAQQAAALAQTSDEKAIACTRETNGWEGQGRYQQARECTQRGLRIRGLSVDRRRVLQINLANSYYLLWHLDEANAMAQNLISQYEAEPPANRLNLATRAFAHYLRGHSHRRMLAREVDEAETYAEIAREDLLRAQRLHLDMAKKFKEDAYSGIAHTCQGGILEAEVTLGLRTPEDALEEIENSLDNLIDPEDFPTGDWLESHGWWCIFGCNIALRHLTDDRLLQHKMAVFTNKADEIAEKLGNWALRERVFTLEYARRQRFMDWTGMPSEWTFDREDIRVIAGAMGRFPAFRPTAWKILESSKIVQES